MADYTANKYLSNKKKQKFAHIILMGWFWITEKDGSTASAAATDAMPVAKLKQSFTGLFWSSPVDKDALFSQGLEEKRLKTTEPISKCPVDHTKLMSRKVSQCPVHEKGSLNPDNNMPELSSLKVPGQKLDLPTERTISSIPKGNSDTSGHWEYPSPQQMLNAMVRKTGPAGIPEDAVESMVDVHNFLNEGVWREVLEWEKPYTDRVNVMPRLLKFTGRPEDLSPRAAFLQLLGKVYPSRFAGPLPFDRHDWTVLRMTPSGNWQEVRYVIDFYEAPDDGEKPVFSVDVRPAADSLENVMDRLKRSAGPLYDKAMGK